MYSCCHISILQSFHPPPSVKIIIPQFHLTCNRFGSYDLALFLLIIDTLKYATPGAKSVKGLVAQNSRVRVLPERDWIQIKKTTLMRIRSASPGGILRVIFSKLLVLIRDYFAELRLWNRKIRFETENSKLKPRLSFYQYLLLFPEKAEKIVDFLGFFTYFARFLALFSAFLFF